MPILDVSKSLTRSAPLSAARHLLRRQRLERSSRVTDHLVGVGHPMLEVAVVDRPALDRRQRAIGKWQDWQRLLRLDQRWPAAASPGLRAARRGDFVA